MRNDERIVAYRKRATDLRAEAVALSDPETKQAIIDIAERYDRLADVIVAKDRR
jgi:hypothetical protein